MAITVSRRCLDELFDFRLSQVLPSPIFRVGFADRQINCALFVGWPNDLEVPNSLHNAHPRLSDCAFMRHFMCYGLEHSVRRAPRWSALNFSETKPYRQLALFGGTSALPPKADMCGAVRDVRFGPSGHFSADFAEWMSSWRVRDEQVVSPDGSNRGEEQRHCVTIDSNSERPETARIT